MSMTRLADEARHAQVVVDIGVGFTKRVEGEDEKQLRPWVAVRAVSSGNVVKPRI